MSRISPTQPLVQVLPAGQVFEVQQGISIVVSPSLHMTVNDQALVFPAAVDLTHPNSRLTFLGQRYIVEQVTAAYIRIRGDEGDIYVRSATDPLFPFVNAHLDLPRPLTEAQALAKIAPLLPHLQSSKVYYNEHGVLLTGTDLGKNVCFFAASDESVAQPLQCDHHRTFSHETVRSKDGFVALFYCTSPPQIKLCGDDATRLELG